MTELLVAPCSYEAARYAVEHWHYSRGMPRSKLVHLGVWEDGQFVGVVIFGRGASPRLVARFGLDQTEGCELVRVACRAHQSPITAYLGRAIKALHRQSPGLRLIVSFADSAHGHHGGIYQAGNWIYLGADSYHAYRVNGTIVHPRVLHLRHGVGGQSIPWLRANVDPNAERIHTPPKHRYVYPLDRAMRRQLAPLALPYPSPPADEGSTGAATPSRVEGRVRSPQSARSRS